MTISKVGLIQMTSGADPEVNLAFIEEQLVAMQAEQLDWVVLPENALVFGQSQDYYHYAEGLNQGPLQEKLAKLAVQFQIWIVVGSFPIKAAERIKTTCLVFSAKGDVYADYDKLHMFDVEVSDNHKSYRESDTFLAGDKVVIAKTPFATLGLSICYDIRFPALFTQLRQLGADIITVPAAFTYVTGEAHWESLLRARAIETQCWVVAVGQTGAHPCGRQTWGHSMVIDPWGRVIDSLSETAGHLIVTIDTNQAQDIRAKMPVMEQARFISQLKN